MITVVNTRPAHQAATLSDVLKQQGLNVIPFPTLTIERLHPLLPDLLCSDIVIFVSANAVPEPLPPLPDIVLAIGPGTKRALNAQSTANVVLPKEYNTPGLLALPLLHMLKNKRIVIFCGENTKPQLKKTLETRGAEIECIITYRRLCPSVENRQKRAFWDSHPDCIISTSQNSLKNLYRLLFNKKDPALLSIPIIVISPEMEFLAHTYGWKSVIRAPNATNDAIVETLSRFKHIR